MGSSGAQLQAAGALLDFVWASSEYKNKIVDASALDEVVVSNTIPLKTDFKAALKRCPVHQLSLAPLLAETIKRLHLGQSISKLSTDFDPVARPTAMSPMAPAARTQLHQSVVVRPAAWSFAPISPPPPGPTGDAPLP